MKKLAFLIFLGWQFLHADSSNIHIVNAASFLEDTSLTPGSIISIFGPNLANTTASAANPGNLPHTLGGVTVSIGSAANTLALFYVSKTQINAMIDPSTPLGPATLTISSPTGTFTKDIVLSASSTPGIFSLFGTGTRDGAIQNAVTFALGPFTVTTNGNPTFLAIYTTGMDLSSAPTVTIGGISVPVQYSGAAPCCPGLQQINVQLTPGLAGAGRVEVAVTAGGKTSNVVEVVILTSPGQGPFPPSGEDQGRSREIAAIAWVPNTSLALVADENDDVVRVIDVKQRQVTQTITLPEGAQPVALAVNDSGTLAVVAERNRGKVAIIDLATNMVTTEVAVGAGPVSVAIAGTVALVVNQDGDTVSAVDLNANTVTNVSVGRGPRGVAADTTANKAYVTNEDDGTLSVIDLTNLAAAPVTINLPANSRPAGIQLVSALGVAVITEPSAGPKGQVLVLTLASGAVSTIDVNPARNGGVNGLAVSADTVYFANQSGGSVSVVPISMSGGSVQFTVTAVQTDLGARSLAVDTLDKLLLVSNQGSGTIVLVDLASNQVTGRINAVRSSHETGGQHDDSSDRLNAVNEPTITSLSQTSASSGSTFTLTINGTNLQNADNVFFVDPATLPGHGNGHIPGESNEMGHGPFGVHDTNITATNIQANPMGTQLTVTITISASEPGNVQRVVRVETPNGDTSFVASSVNTFQIN